MAKYTAPAPRYAGPAAHSTPGNNKPIHRIVLHSTVSPCEPGGAQAIARYFHSKKAGGSAHYVVDPGEVVQVVYDNVIAWHAPPNQHSLGIEMCDMPNAGTAKRWADANHKAMFKRTARLVAELCLAYEVPPYYVGVGRLKRGARGVTTHNNVSQAFHQSTHWDPGAWPRLAFMREVRRQVRAIKKEKK